MEQDHFDQLARGLAAGQSRRGLVRNLAGTALGGVLAAVGASEAGAKQHRKQDSKAANHPADEKSTHRKKKHRCPAGQTRCPVGAAKHGKPKQACVDLKTDAKHCGQCTTACAADETCQGGTCKVACQPQCQGKQCGDDGCGGRCGTCPTGQQCQQGKCASAVCPGQTDCNGQCVDTQTDVTNCGACGKVCALPHTTVNKCVAGVCAPSQCASGWRYCGGDFSQGCATDPTTDPNNCGGCGIVCGTDQTCSGGQCVCPAGLTLCNGACVDLQTDPANCGVCGTLCILSNATATCNGGSCAIASCDAGYADCDGDPANGCETNITADTGNCGSCGATCAAEQFCRAFPPGCGGQYLCCQPDGAVCFNACDCCSAASGGGCAFFNGGQNPGTCV